MNTDEFAGALAKYSLEETVRSVITVLREKQKKELPEETVIRQLYESMSDEAKSNAELLVRFSVASAFFNLLVVIDNCDAIEDGEEKGEFSLYYTKNGVSQRLGEPPNLLHDNLPAFSELISKT